MTDVDPANPETHDTQVDVAELGLRLQQAEDGWKRAAADLDNLRKRFQRELGRASTAEHTRALGYWITTIDDLERSLSHGTADADAIVDGVRVIVSDATAILESLGYPRFGSVGELFDPLLHEAVTTVPATETLSPKTIVAVIKPGYGTPANVLRPASVVVAKGPD